MWTYLWLLLLLLFLGCGRGTTTRGSGRGATATATATATTTTGDGCKFGRTSSNEVVNRLAVKFGEELVEALLVAVNADGREEFGDVARSGRGVAADLEQEVGCNVAHFFSENSGEMGS